ncbi:MAG: 5-(carboxyamino)imidazole ribonucleotide synthase [Lentisphaeria bacterium]|jgi:5-(carboxyamino)imidazole ribonucleotide synthase
MSHHIAIVGSGQLARMMALDGIPMGMTFSFLAEAKEDTRCVDKLGIVVIRKHTDSAEALFQALGKPDVITVEKEHVDVDLLNKFTSMCAVHPNPSALETLKNRRIEKQFLQSLNIPIANFHSVTNKAQLQAAIDTLQKPIFLKSEEEGYDGYNQYKVTDDNAKQVMDEIAFPSYWVAESFIPFQREVSFLAARTSDNNIVMYPAVENYHRNGTLLTSLAPAPNISEQQIDNAREMLTKIMTTLDYVGLMCMECFVWDNKILVNEIAPRVHNSGHWTSKGALTSQFENHLRAVIQLPLGSTETCNISGMLNLLGVSMTAEQACDANSYLTLYGKTTRARRKLGHVTVCGSSYEEVTTRLKALEALVYGAAEQA